MDVLDTPVKAAIPGWEDYGNETGWKACLNNWCGLTQDRSNGRTWLDAPGGHNGGSNTGVYEFAFYRMEWSIRRLPSDTTRWSLQYRNRVLPQVDSYSSCQESVEATTAKKAAETWSPINDWEYDDIYWDEPQVAGGLSAPSVGTPTSSHTYADGAYDPVSNDLIKCGRGARLWRFNLDINERWYKRSLNDGNYLGIYTKAGAFVLLDERTGEFNRTGSIDGYVGKIGYDLRADTWTAGFAMTGGWSIYNPAFARYGRTVVALNWIDKGGGGQYWVYDLDSRTVTQGGTTTLVQFGGGLSYASFSNISRYQGGSASLCYVPPINRYMYVTEHAAQEAKTYWVDPTTTPWTLTPDTEPNAPTLHPNACQRLFWDDTLMALVLFDEADNNLWIKGY
jgi:hypothetical protein